MEARAPSKERRNEQAGESLLAADNNLLEGCHYGQQSG
jgi:hypothetical protein